MNTAPQATALALLLLLPSPFALEAGDHPTVKKEVVIDDDDFVMCDDDDSSVVVRSDQHSRHGFIGVSLIEITPELRVHYGTPKEAGVLVGQVEPDSPAAKAGIQVGDIITAADGESIDSVRQLSRAIRHKKAGENIKIDISRDRTVKHLTVTVAERKGRELDMGDLSRRIREHVRILPDHDWPAVGLLGHSADLDRLRDRLEELEKRLKEIEKKLSAR
ncbi:MAG TPA: PDZ domain-containing protein [Thermoanaerobaculia bacterium]|nr:PDZ domain-containing protein [Thermoanaerobaculia bacterium]